LHDDNHALEVFSNTFFVEPEDMSSVSIMSQFKLEVGEDLAGWWFFEDFIDFQENLHHEIPTVNLDETDFADDSISRKSIDYRGFEGSRSTKGFLASRADIRKLYRR
jgi:hypothetical protein